MGARLRTNADSYPPHPTNAPSVDSCPSSGIHRPTLMWNYSTGSGPHFGTSASYSLGGSNLGSDHRTDILGNESSTDLDLMYSSRSDNTSDTTTRDLSHVTAHFHNIS